MGGRNFCPAREIRAHAPREKFENQVFQIGRKWISDYLILKIAFLKFSQKLLLQLEIFAKHIILFRATEDINYYCILCYRKLVDFE